ncbi:MAG: N-acetylglucosamine kinase [Bacteroidia bacterium]
MKLIADSGSTKTDWCIINNDGSNKKVLNTVGYNPYFIDTESIFASISENLLPHIEAEKIQEVFFYGAGCSTPEKVDTVKKALKKCFTNATEIFVGHDLLAAARALLGTEKGFAAILGTGTNTCIYNGFDVETNIDSLGYLLGDEGSASYLGKKLVRDFMRGRLEPNMHNRFKERFGIENNEQIFTTLYTTQFPNRYLAGFAKFADEYSNHPYIRNKVRDGFYDFFKNLVSKYPNYKNFKFNCVGSVAFYYKDILEETAQRFDMPFGIIIQSPLNNLVEYHLKKYKPRA